MTMNYPAAIRKPNEGRRIGVVGDVYRFLATGEDTDGKYATPFDSKRSRNLRKSRGAAHGPENR